MIETIYVEKIIKEHPRTKLILSKLKKAKTIEIDRYGEIFNKRNQNFRIQKNNPDLILAFKNDALNTFHSLTKKPYETFKIYPRNHFPDFQFTSLNVDKHWAKSNPQLVASFMRAFIRAHRLFFSDQKLMGEIAVKETGITRKHADIAWKEYTEENIFSAEGDISLEGIQCLIDESAMIRSISQRRGTNATEYISRQFINDALNKA